MEVRPLLERGAIAVLPIGAAAKEHGPHLPLATDYLTAEALGARLAARADVLVWPTVGYAYYPAFVDYPGSTSVPEEVFEATVEALLRDLHRAGAKRALVWNTGVSTIRAVEAACIGMQESVRCAAVHVYRAAGYLSALDRRIEQPSLGARGEGHADEAETSVMLHLHPERVRMELAPCWTAPMAKRPWSPTDPSHPSYSPSGVRGDATLATAEKGAALVEAMLADAEAALARLATDESWRAPR